MNIEPWRGFFECVVFVHGSNVLETRFFSRFGSNVELTRNLATIDTVKKVAVVNEKAWSNAALCAKPHKHHVETENPHISSTP